MEMHTHQSNDTYNVYLRGRFTFSDNLEFRKTILNKIMDSAFQNIALNMEHVEFVDSAALGMLLLAHDEAKEHHKSLSIQGLGVQVRRIFDMARFDQFFTY